MATDVTLGSESIADDSEAITGYRVAEFFAGVGLVRMGLEQAGMSVVWANDIEADKAEMYRGHFRDEDDHFLVKDIANIEAQHLPDGLSLAWASFPCIDVSLAGWRRGLNGAHTGTFWHFIRIMAKMGDRRPPVVALENVTGLATSHNGKDLIETVQALNELGYSVDVLTLDARHFVPQSRPRLFIVGAQEPPLSMLSSEEDGLREEDRVLRPARVQKIYEHKELRTHRAFLPSPGPLKSTGLAECVEQLEPNDPQWWDEVRMKAFLGSLSPIQSARLAALKSTDSVSYRTAYRRTRNGRPVWEIRADEISGCLRTARGGSSKQALVMAGGGSVKVRWMTAREYANLMGARGYRLDNLRRNQALFGFGDAVCVNAVEWLSSNYIMPLIKEHERLTAS